MKTVLICHSGATLTRYGFSRWLSSFSQLQGLIVIKEDGSRAKQRITAEIRRVGLNRFLFDVVPYRVYSKIFHSRKNSKWEEEKLRDLQRMYKKVPEDTEVLITNSPNSDMARDFLSRLEPDMVVARCKTIIKSEIHSIPTQGTFILHPGICPEYRNAHGCFWALANDEPEMVGMTLLKIDDGIDTGPIYGYYSYEFNSKKETPSIIHNRVVYDNLDALEKKLFEIHTGKADIISTKGRKSGVWGQPWLTKYMAIRLKGVLS